MKNRGNNNSTNNNSKYRPRTAAVASAATTKPPAIDRSRDASELLELGVPPHEVSELCGMTPFQVARIQEYNEKKRIFLMTGELDI